MRIGGRLELTAHERGYSHGLGADGADLLHAALDVAAVFLLGGGAAGFAGPVVLAEPHEVVAALECEGLFPTASAMKLMELRPPWAVLVNFTSSARNCARPSRRWR